ncbi:MAG TPA: tol-pal system protein YbgF [Kofleriaceae bacterium]|nr:tol-pal system protein YbgF [Kofleriaceae bacterium]
MTTRIACCLLLAGACASPMSSLRADNRRLTQNVDELRADRRAQDRKIKDLEHQLAIAKSTQTTPDVPQLPVEVMTPAHAPHAAAAGDPRVVAVAEDGTEIVYEGDAALGKQAALGDEPIASRTTDRLEVTQRIPPISARAAHRSLRADPIVHDSVPANDAAANDYRSAVELVKTGKHDEAVTALRAFLKTYPRHDYADNAQYWLGESFYARKDYQQALTEFRATIETYPRGNKVPDALLKVGYCYQALGKADKARAVLEQVVNLYPKSEPAALASKRLETP